MSMVQRMSGSLTNAGAERGKAQFGLKLIILMFMLTLEKDRPEVQLVLKKRGDRGQEIRWSAVNVCSAGSAHQQTLSSATSSKIRPGLAVGRKSETTLECQFLTTTDAQLLRNSQSWKGSKTKNGDDPQTRRTWPQHAFPCISPSACRLRLSKYLSVGITIFGWEMMEDILYGISPMDPTFSSF